MTGLRDFVVEYKRTKSNRSSLAISMESDSQSLWYDSDE